MAIRLIAALLALISVQAHAQDASEASITSEYTDLPLDGPCAAVATDPLGGVFQCAGYSGYGVLVADSDLRTSVFFGHIGPWYPEGAWESFQSFNSIGDTVEWRLADGVPFATILRWSIDFDTAGEGDESDKGNVLVVSKVGQPGVGEACIVGYVDARANDDANERAREIADTLTMDFQCRVDEPEFHGEQGFLTPVPVRSFGP